MLGQCDSDNSCLGFSNPSSTTPSHPLSSAHLMDCMHPITSNLYWPAPRHAHCPECCLSYLCGCGDVIYELQFFWLETLDDAALPRHFSLPFYLAVCQETLMRPIEWVSKAHTVRLKCHWGWGSISFFCLLTGNNPAIHLKSSGGSSIATCLPSMPEAMGSVLSTA